VVLRCEDGSSWRCTLSDGLRNRRAMGRVRLYRYRHSISSRLDHSDVHCCCRRCCNLEHRSSRSLRSIAALIDMAHKQQTNNKQRTNKARIKPLYLIGEPKQGCAQHCVGSHHNDSTEIIVTAFVSLPRFPSAVIGALICSAGEAGPAGPRHEALDEPVP
jgi:hypothetical protein